MFLMVPIVPLSFLATLGSRDHRALMAVVGSLGGCHAMGLSTNSQATVRLVAITILEALYQYLFGPSGKVLMALLHFLKKVHQLLTSSLLGICELAYKP
jgi:hypothetical protein